MWYEESFQAQKQTNKNVQYQNSASICDTDYAARMIRNFPYGRHSLTQILVNDQLDTLFSMYLFHASTYFEQQMLINRRIKLCQYIVMSVQ